MFDNVIAEKSYKRLLIFTRTNKLFPVRNKPTFNHLINLCSEHWLGSTVLFCLFDRVLNVISIKDIDDNECKLKARDLIFYKIKCHLTKGSKPFCIYWLQQSYASVTSCIILRNVLFQLMCKICLAGFAHCAIVVKQWCWNRTNDTLVPMYWRFTPLSTRWKKFKWATKLCHFPENNHNSSDKWFSNNL